MNRMVAAVVVVGVIVGSSNLANAQQQPYCDLITQLAESAHSRRAEGVTEATMRGNLPPRSAAANAPGTPQAQLLIDMHDILDLLFAFDKDEMDAQTLSSYYGEKCRRREQGLPVSDAVEAVAPALRLCATGDAALRQQCAVGAAAAAGVR